MNVLHTYPCRSGIEKKPADDYERLFPGTAPAVGAKNETPPCEHGTRAPESIFMYRIRSDRDMFAHLYRRTRDIRHPRETRPTVRRRQYAYSRGIEWGKMGKTTTRWTGRSSTKRNGKNTTSPPGSDGRAHR